MRAPGPAVTADVLERLRDAQNRHDLDAFLDCFDSGLPQRTAGASEPGLHRTRPVTRIGAGS